MKRKIVLAAPIRLSELAVGLDLSLLLPGELRILA